MFKKKVKTETGRFESIGPDTVADLITLLRDKDFCKICAEGRPGETEIVVYNERYETQEEEDLRIEADYKAMMARKVKEEQKMKELESFIESVDIVGIVSVPTKMTREERISSFQSRILPDQKIENDLVLYHDKSETYHRVKIKRNMLTLSLYDPVNDSVLFVEKRLSFFENPISLIDLDRLTEGTINEFSIHTT